MDSKTTVKAVTPLPKLHMLCLMLMRLAHPILLKACFPFLPEAILEIMPEKDEAKVGVYVGWIEGTYTFCTLLTLWLLLRASDRYGRKPTVLVCVSIACLFAIAFGLARSMVAFALTRSLTGLFMGSQPILRVIVAETVDQTNEGTAFALFSASWQSGLLLAPIVGGVLSHPAERYRLFSQVSLFKAYPYLLPCLASVVPPVVAVIIAIPFLRETRPPRAPNSTSYVPLTQDDNEEEPSHVSSVSTQPIDMRAVLTGNTLTLLISWGWLMLSQAAFESISIVHASTPVALGGLGLSTAEIGTCLTVMAVGITTSTLTILPRASRRFGPMRLARMTVWSIPFTLLSMIPWSIAAKYHNGDEGVRFWLWLSMLLTLVLRAPTIIAMQSVEMYASNAVPRRELVSSMSGAMSYCGNASWSFGPMIFGSMYAASIKTSLGASSAFFAYSLLGVGAIIFVNRVREGETWRELEKVDSPVP